LPERVMLVPADYRLAWDRRARRRGWNWRAIVARLRGGFFVGEAMDRA